MIASAAERVAAWIREHRLRWRLIRVRGSTLTVGDAARALGVSVSVVVKTLVVVDDKGRTYAVLVPGDRKLDLSRLADLVGARVRLAKPREVLNATGYPTGGVPPVALPSDVRLIVDEALLSLERAYGGGGENGVLLEFDPRELVRATMPLVAKVSA